MLGHRAARPTGRKPGSTPGCRVTHRAARCNAMVHTYPEGFIPVGDAFAQALQLIEDYSALLRAIDEATKDAERHEHINKRDASVRRVEKLMRNALADGHLQPFIRGQSGQIEQIVDRREFRRESFGVPGIENVPHHLTNPGPDTDGRPVLLKISNFGEWLTMHRQAIDPFRTGVPGKPSAINLVAREHQRRLSCGEALPMVSKEAAYLKEWLDRTYPKAPNTPAKTIENRIRDAHRKRPLE